MAGRNTMTRSAARSVHPRWRCRGAHRLRRAGIPFGFITCVTRTSLPDVPWLYELARTEGASLLQLRPLALTGRGATGLDDAALDAEDAERLAIVAALLGDTAEPPFVQCDLAPTGQLLTAGPAQFPLLDGNASTASLSDLVNPLVIGEDGTIRPFVYGMPERYQLGTIEDLASGGWRGMGSEQRVNVATLVEDTFSAVSRHSGRFVDWYAVLTDVAERGDVALPSPTRIPG
jgi:hypothetical protein